MLKVRAALTIIALVGATITGTSLVADAPPAGPRTTCSVSPTGPVQIEEGSSEGFVGGSACDGHQVSVSPTNGVAGIDGCSQTPVTLDSHGAFFVHGCDVGETEVVVRDGTVVVQTIDIEVVPPSE